jgi:hypothetical protein
MGRRIAFVIFLGGCFNVGPADNSGCSANDEQRCQSPENGAPCDPALAWCSYPECQCRSGITVCPTEDLSVPLDLRPPLDLTPPADDGGRGD